MALSDPASELADHPLAKSAASERRWQKFALMVAHDLKEPIRNIGSCAKLLADMDSEGADAGVDEAQVRQWLVDCSERLVHLMDALVQHAKNGREEFEQRLDLDAKFLMRLQLCGIRRQLDDAQLDSAGYQ